MNPYLTPTSHRLLVALRDGDDKYAIAEGREVWVDSNRFSRGTLNHLIRLCLIRLEPTSSGDKTEIWMLNEEGEKIIDDASYVPLIVSALNREKGD